MSKIIKDLKSSGSTAIGYRCDGCGQSYKSLYDLKDPEHYGWFTIDDQHYCQNCKGDRK